MAITREILIQKMVCDKKRFNDNLGGQYYFEEGFFQHTNDEGRINFFNPNFIPLEEILSDTVEFKEED